MSLKYEPSSEPLHISGPSIHARVALHAGARAQRSNGSEAGSYLRLIDPCITQLKAQGTSGTCNESNEEDRMADVALVVGWQASKLPWREAGPLNHRDDLMDSDQ